VHRLVDIELSGNSPRSSISTCGLFLHAAAVLLPEGVVLLLGHSSSGKTTLCSMLASHFPVVSDDIVFIFQQPSGAWCVMDGTELKSKEYGRYGLTMCLEESELKIYSLLSIIRIFAAQETVLQPLPSIRACEYLMDAIFEIDIQRKVNNSDIIIQWFSLMAKMAKRYQCWQLQFCLDEKMILSSFQKTIKPSSEKRAV